jgi:hypothetical protein
VWPTLMALSSRPFVLAHCPCWGRAQQNSTIQGDEPLPADVPAMYELTTWSSMHAVQEGEAHRNRFFLPDISCQVKIPSNGSRIGSSIVPSSGTGTGAAPTLTTSTSSSSFGSGSGKTKSSWSTLTVLNGASWTLLCAMMVLLACLAL